MPAARSWPSSRLRDVSVRLGAQRQLELLVAALDIIGLDVFREALVAIVIAIAVATTLVATTVLAATLETTTVFHRRLVQATLFR